jgi:hypothetical protein
MDFATDHHLACLSFISLAHLQVMGPFVPEFCLGKFSQNMLRSFGVRVTYLCQFTGNFQYPFIVLQLSFSSASSTLSRA